MAAVDPATYVKVSGVRLGTLRISGGQLEEGGGGGGVVVRE